MIKISSLCLASPAPAREAQACRRCWERQAGQGQELRRPGRTRGGGHRSLSGARVRGVEPGKGACRWVSGNSTMRRGIPVWQTRSGKTDSMLTMIPAQNGVSLTSREELMPAMRKPTTVTAMPRASCSSASSSGNRQPQHVRASSSPHSLGAPAPLFGPMSSGSAASAAGGPPWLRAPRPGSSLPMAAAGAAARAARGGPRQHCSASYGGWTNMENIWRDSPSLWRPRGPAAEGESRGVINCQHAGQDAAPAWPGGVARCLLNPTRFRQAAGARACMCAYACVRVCVCYFPHSKPQDFFGFVFVLGEVQSKVMNV